MILNHQYAHHSHKESKDLGAVTPLKAIQSFDEFDWDGESNQAEKIQKCSPTLSLISKPNELMIWVSSVKINGSLEFVSECLYPGEVSLFFGLFKREGIVSLHSNNFSKSQARKAIELFIVKDFDQLKVLYESA